MADVRTTEVWICPVCEGRTNLTTEDGRHIFCPNAGVCWHHEVDACIRHLAFPHPWHGFDTHIANKMSELLEKHRVQGDVRNDVADIDADAPMERPSLFTSGIFRTFQQPVGMNCQHRVQGFCGREGILFVFPDPRGGQL